MIAQATLGRAGPSIGRLVYGAMALAGFHGEADAARAVETPRRAIDSGMMIDTGDACAAGNDEPPPGRAPDPASSAGVCRPAPPGLAQGATLI